MNGILYLTVLRISSELSAITHMQIPREGGRLNKEIKMATQWKYTEASRIEITEGQIFGIRSLIGKIEENQAILAERSEGPRVEEVRASPYNFDMESYRMALSNFAIASPILPIILVWLA